MIGLVFGLYDFDTGIGNQIFDPSTESFSYMVKYQPNGEYEWARFLGSGIFGSILNDIYVDSREDIFFTGGFQDTLDLDPGPGSFRIITPPTLINFFAAFQAKWSQDSCSALAVIIDSVRSVNCTEGGFASGYGLDGVPPYSYSWNTNPISIDSFVSFDSAAFYELTVTDSVGCSSRSNILVNGPGSFGGTDLKLNMVIGEIRPGFNTNISLSLINDGCIGTDVQLKLVLDSIFLSSNFSPNPDTTIGDTLIWRLNDFDYDDQNFRVSSSNLVSLNAMIGDIACMYAVAEPIASDANPADNVVERCRSVVASYDPNDIQATPEGICEEGFTLKNQKLTYKIRFQNTGNASAINIFLLDTLDSNLDLNSLRVIGQSHDPMITEVLSDRILKFRFDNIFLPDSSSDEPNSHGYVIYEISPLDDLPDGTEIRNRAGIYFDFNEPVITNTVLNTLLDTLPELNTAISQEGSSLIAEEMNATYQWLDCNNGRRPIPGATARIFSPTVNGNYALRIQQGTCIAISSCVEVLNVSIDERFQSQLKVYPNPSQGSFLLDLGRQHNIIEIKVLNALGQVIQKGNYEFQKEIHLNLPAQKGIYFIRITADGKEALTKIVKN